MSLPSVQLDCVSEVPENMAAPPQTRWMARRPPPLQPRTVRRVVCVLLLLVSAGLVLPALRVLLAAPA